MLSTLPYRAQVGAIILDEFHAMDDYGRDGGMNFLYLPYRSVSAYIEYHRVPQSHRRMRVFDH